MVQKTTVNLTEYEIGGLRVLRKIRQTSQSEIVRESIRLLMKTEGIKPAIEAIKAEKP